MVKRSGCLVISINKLPDEVLLEIFEHYLLDDDPDEFIKRFTESWQLLVHVCRRWRHLVFGSPCRLNLRLFCSPTTTWDKLDIWPELPLVFDGSISPSNVDNTLAVVKRHNRVSGIDLHHSIAKVEKVWAAMQIPFPELTILRLSWNGPEDELPILPDSFLGGSAPRLRELFLRAVNFPGLPKLILSATNLTKIRLINITYVSPETMVTCLSALTSLKYLHLEFLYRPRPEESRHPPLSTRSILPALTHIQFEGTGEYLVDLGARIDVPRLKVLCISPFDPVDFALPQLAQFISRTPIFNTLNEARVIFYNDYVRLDLLSPTFGFEAPKIQLSCAEPDRQFLTLAQIRTLFPPLLSTLNDLFICEFYQFSCLGFESLHLSNNQWLELLRPFITVQSLYVSREFVPGITAALQELVGERISEVLPSLKNLFLEELERRGPIEESIRLFVAARQLSNHPIVVSLWTKAADEDWDTNSDWRM